MKFTKEIFCIFLIFFFGNYFFGQTQFNRFSISRLSQDDGLSQGSNYFMYEDQKGFMWITGNDALNRFDGNNVKVFNLNYYFKNCPALQQGYGFAESENELFVGSTRGLYVYNYQKEVFSLVEIFGKFDKDKTTMPFGFSGRKIWCFNKENEIATYDILSKKVELITKILLPSIKSVHVYDSEGNLFYNRMPIIDKHQNIWLFGRNQIATYNISTKKIDFPQKAYLEKNKVELFASAYNSREDKIYLGTKNKILILNKNEIQEIDEINHQKLEYITNIAVSDSKIAFRSKDDLIIADKTFKNSRIFDKNFERSFLYHLDKTGRLWFCDDGKGMVIINFKGNILHGSNELKENSSTKKIKTFGVGSIAEFPTGEILVAHSYLFSDTNGQLTKWMNSEYLYGRTYNALIGEKFTDPYRKGIWQIKDNTIQSEIEINFYKDFNHKTIDFTIKNTNLGRFQGMGVFEKFDPLLTFTMGVFRLNLQAKKLEPIAELPEKNAFYISKLSQNRFAVSYLNKDMLLAKIEDNGNIKFLQKILPNVQSFYLQEDLKNKKFWVGSNEGVYYLDENFKILKKFDFNNGLAGTYIYGILIDDFGKVWCSHQHGLSSIDTKNFSIINYDKSDGIQDWDYNNRAFYKSSKGVLYFGGVNGFNCIKPPLEIKSFYKPEIYFDEILVNNKRFPAENGYNSLEKISLKNDENNISIKALVKDLEFGGQQKLVYKIEDQDQNWKYISKKNPLILNSLSPGNYKIIFGIYNKFSQKITAQKTLEIKISKAFYQTFLFWLLVGGLIFGSLIFLYSYWKFIKQKQFYQHQLALETQRTKITADLHDDIGATLSSLQINSAVAGKLMEKDQEQARKILKQIETQSKHISENIGDIIWSLKPGKDEFMSLSTRIRNFANEILGSSEIPFKINIDNALNQEITDFTMRKNIMMICKEAMNNIAKYSKATDVKLNLTKEKDNYLLEISDNGNGFNQAEITGNGLQNMKRRAEEMGGNFEIISEHGTQLKILIPEIRD